LTPDRPSCVSDPPRLSAPCRAFFETLDNGWDSYFADIIQTNNETLSDAYGDMYGDIEY
jgi:hypothetical protein